MNKTNIFYQVFLKYQFFLGTPPQSEQMAHSFKQMSLDYCRKKKKFLARGFLLLSFSRFQKDLLHSMHVQLPELRLKWLLENCYPNQIAALDSKEIAIYFSELEKASFDEYQTRIYAADNLINHEFKKIRTHYFLDLLKIHSNKLILLIFLFLCILIALSVAAKANSLTIWEQIEWWFRFLFKNS